MNIAQALREYLISSKDFPNAPEFLVELDKIEEILHNSSNYNDGQVVPCINLEVTFKRQLLDREKYTQKYFVGLDGVGKTTLAKELASTSDIRTRLLPSIPPDLVAFRSYFDQQEESIKRNFYSMCNIRSSDELRSTSDSTVVILDRYWPSTIAYYLAHRSELTSINESLQWPLYLVQPSHVFYIYCDESERRARIDQRQNGMPIDVEEEQLANDDKFRGRLDEIYRRIPNIKLINSNRSPSEIAKEIIEQFSQK